tara:strand:- start:290 stop:667 length:378 start_codon:yes stop_codon:yes gene_type:complete
MKKTIASIASLTLLSACGYPSFYEAQYECAKWVQEGDTYKGIIKSIAETNDNKSQIKELFRDTVNTFSLRKCQKDAETNQVLGLNLKNRVAGQTYIFNENQRIKNSPSRLIDRNLDWQVEKRFRY